jgi:integrase
MKAFEKYKKGISVLDISQDFLRRFERKKLSEGITQSKISSYFRDIRRIINYFMYEEKVIPKSFQYPFGKGGTNITSFFPFKQVLKQIEIDAVMAFDDFETYEHEFALDIWLFLYYCNGTNFADLLRMRWDNIKGDYIVFRRKKTETTRKNNIKEIVAPLTPKLQELIDKVGSESSPFILGRLKEGYSESTFENLCHKLSSAINQKLTEISNNLNLSVPLKLKTARDTYATSLLRNGVSKDKIGLMLGHSNSQVTEHYLGSLDYSELFKINGVLS